MRHARTMITALRFATAARAQTNAPTPPTPAQMAQHGVQRYTALLSLTSAQQEQAPAIFTPEAAAEAGLHATEHADGEALNAAIKTGGRRPLSRPWLRSSGRLRER